MKKNLYQIKEEHLNVMRQIEENDGEITPEIEQALALTNEDFENKAISYGYVIKSFADNQDLIKQEIDRLKSLLEREIKYEEAVREKLKYAMLEFGVNEINTPTLKLSFRKSEAVEIINEEEIAAEFIKVKETKTVDKTKLKAAIKEGRPVAGAKLVINQNLQIK